MNKTPREILKNDGLVSDLHDTEYDYKVTEKGLMAIDSGIANEIEKIFNDNGIRYTRDGEHFIYGLSL